MEYFILPPVSLSCFLVLHEKRFGIRSLKILDVSMPMFASSSRAYTILLWTSSFWFFHRGLFGSCGFRLERKLRLCFCSLSVYCTSRKTPMFDLFNNREALLTHFKMLLGRALRTGWWFFTPSVYTRKMPTHPTWFFGSIYGHLPKPVAASSWHASSRCPSSSKQKAQRSGIFVRAQHGVWSRSCLGLLDMLCNQIRTLPPLKEWHSTELRRRTTRQAISHSPTIVIRIWKVFPLKKILTTSRITQASRLQKHRTRYREPETGSWENFSCFAASFSKTTDLHMHKVIEPSKAALRKIFLSCFGRFIVEGYRGIEPEKRIDEIRWDEAQ